MKAFNLPFNSTELQRFADGQSKLVTVHVDPDFPRNVYVTAKEHAEVMTAHMSMTVFNDLTLEEILDVIEAAAKSNPKRRAFHNEQLQAAIERRARESGFFPDSRAPSSYRAIEVLRKQADRLAKVEIRPVPIMGPTVAPGSVMDRSGQSPVHRVRPPSAPSPATPRSTSHETMTFAPIKDSKL